MPALRLFSRDSGKKSTDILRWVNDIEVIVIMYKKFLPKTQSGRDILLLVVLVVPLAIAGVIWGILGDFSEPRDAILDPTSVDLPSTPVATPAAFYIFDDV
jgi:hypothetical protein